MASYKDMALIERLRDGRMLDHPGVKAYLLRAQQTGDSSRLMAFLKRHPEILAMAERNIALAKLQSADNPFKPYPTREEASEHLSGPLKFGFVNQYDDRLGVPWNTLCRPIIDFGRVGSGKSILAKYLIVQAVSRPRGFNVLIPDLKKEYRDLHSISKSLKIITNDRLMFNPLEVPGWCHPRDHLVAFAKAFVSENYLVGTSENELIDIVAGMYSKRGIFEGSQNYPTLTDLYNLVSQKLSGTKSFKYSDILLWLRNRLRPYVLSDSFNCQHGIPFETFTQENLVLEMDTGFTDRMFNFSVATIVHQLYMHNKAHGLGGSKLRHWIIVDEARILFQAQRDASMFGESIINEDITKCREFGIGFLILSQETASINQILRSLSYLKIAFPLNDQADLKFIRDSFGLSKEQTQHLFKLPPYSLAVVRYGGFERPFLLQVPLFRIKRQLSDEQVAESMADFWAGLEEKIRKPEQPVRHKDRPELPPACSALLFYLGKNPFTKVSDLVQAPGFTSPGEVNKALAWLTEHGFVQMGKIRTSRTKKSLYPVLLQEAFGHLGLKGLPGKGGYEHQLYQHLISQWLKAQGWEAGLEGRMRGSTKAIDVLAHSRKEGHVAYEVTLHLDNLIENVREDLNAGVAEVVIVTKDRSGRDQAATLIAEAEGLEDVLDKIAIHTIDRYFPAQG